MTGIRRNLALSVLFVSCIVSGCRPADSAQTGDVHCVASPPELAAAAGSLIEEFNRLLSQGTRLSAETVAGGDLRAEPADCAAVMGWREPPAGRFSARIGWTGMLVAVHPENPLDGLSAEDVRAVFAGRIERWEDLRGPAGAIRAIVYGIDTGWAELFAAAVLGPNRTAGGAVVAPSPGAMRTAVLEDPLAIGYTTGFESTKGLKILAVDGAAAAYQDFLSGAYPFRIPIFLDAADPPPLEIEQFAGWTQSVAGQTVLMQMQPQE